MLGQDQIAAASQTLHDHWRAGTKLGGLEASQRPNDRAEGYAIQAGIENYATKTLFGWKIAATSEAGQRHINVDGPMAAPLRWREMKCASPSPNSPFACTRTCHRDRRLTPCKRLSMRSTPFTRR